MNIVKGLIQGSKEWLDFRAKHFGASDAPVMMGLSSYKTRDDLLRERKTGVAEEVDSATQARFDDGHKTEALARKIIEGHEGEELFPVTATLDFDGLPLSASFDGVDMFETFCFEHKLINTKLAAITSIDDLDMQYKVQMTQQMLVGGLKKCLFVASDGTKENMVQLWYKYDDSLASDIVKHWRQFAADLESYEAPEVTIEPIAEQVESLPALNVQIEGGVTKSNLDSYKATALQFIRSINTELETDEDFANADALVKFCSKTEKELDAVKKAALSQTADIDALFTTIDDLKAEMRTKRLALDKLVKSRKQSIKGGMIMGARNVFRRHLDSLDERLHGAVCMPNIKEDFTGVIKNKRTIESLRNALNTELARVKIEANEVADAIDANVKAWLELTDDSYAFLFADIQHIITKPHDDFVAVVKIRIAEHQEAEAKRMEAEREKIRKEEQAKAEAKAREQAEAKAAVIARNERAERELRERTADVEHDAEQISVETKKTEPKKISTASSHVNDTNVADMKPKSDFDKWWDIEGSGFTPYDNEDMETFAHRIARLAWSNGQYCASRNIDYGSPRAG